MSYLEKYLKYKNKYLALKQMVMESAGGNDILSQIDNVNATETSVNLKPKTNVIQGLFNNIIESESDSLSDLGRLTDTDEDEMVQKGGDNDSDSSLKSSDSSLKSSDSDNLDVEDSI